MSVVVGVLTTRAGQTSTSWATSLAWTLADRHSVLLVDCDMEGGTIADLLYLRTMDRSVGNCFGERRTTPSELLEQAVAVPERRHLRVVPGIHATYGFDIAECLRRLGHALRGQEDDFVVADLGHPLSHPALRSPRAAADAVSATFHRIFIVIRDDPALLVRSIEVLRMAQLPHGEIVLCEQRSRAHKRLVEDTFQRELPELSLRYGWAWDDRGAARTSETGRPITLPRVEEQLNL